MISLSLSAVRTDGGTQPRAAIDSRVVDEYATEMKAGANFPPVDVFYDGENYWLADGFHRRDAVDWRGHKEIECEVHQGTLEDAQWYSFGANKTNGMRRTNDDKQRAVKAALVHPKGAELSDGEIARHVGVGHNMVSEWRKKLEPIFTKSKDSPQALANQRPDAEPTHRQATRGGKTYKIKIEKIGRCRRPNDGPAAQQEDEALHPQTRKKNAVTATILSFMASARHLAELAEWLMEESYYVEAQGELQQGIEMLQPIIERIEKQAIAADPLNRSRLHIQEERCP